MSWRPWLPVQLLEHHANILQWGTKLNGPTKSGAATPSGSQTPVNLMDLEMTMPGTPQNEEHDAVEAIQSFSNPPMNRYRMLCACLMNFGNGLNDSAPGALIPYIEKYVLSLQIT